MHLNWLSGDDKADLTLNGQSAADAQPFELSVIDLITLSGRRLAWVATNGRRTSDWLNASDAIYLRGSQAVELASLDAPPPPPPNQAEEESLVTSEVLFAIPPPLPANRHLRLHRRRVHVRMVLRGYHVSGQAHVRPGAEVGTHLFRGGRRFVPLTDVEVRSIADPELNWTLPVVIVNAAHVEELLDREPIRRAAGEVAPSADPVVAPPAAPPAAPAPVPVASAAPVPAENIARRKLPSDDADGSRTAVLMTCLELLLSEGVIDIIEFQEKRASITQG